MNVRARGLASRFEGASASVEEFVKPLDDRAMKAVCSSEQCTVAAMVCHVARVHLLAIGWIESLLSGEDLADLTMADIDQNNNVWFSADEQLSREDALALLRANRQNAVEYLRGLRDTDLDRAGRFGPFNGARVSVQTLMEKILIGDPLTHLASIKATVASPAVADMARLR